MFKFWVIIVNVYFLLTCFLAGIGILGSIGIYFKTSWDHMKSTPNANYDINGNATINIGKFDGNITPTEKKTV